MPETSVGAGLYLAIDQGGHASRAAVYDGHGRVRAQALAEVAVCQPQEGWVEHDPEQVVASVQSVVAQAAGALGAETARLAAAGLATQRSSLTCWDRETGEALAPIISWQDRRTAGELAPLRAHQERIHRVSGLFVTAHYGASKFRWCLDHLGAVRAAREAGRLAWGPLASFLAFRLLRERPLLADPANASRTLLWNLKTRDWDPWLLELFGLPADPLPRCVPSRYPYGHLPVGEHAVPLTIVTGDQPAALFALGQPQAGTAYVNLGTGAFVQRPLGHYPGYAPRLLTSVVFQDGDELTYGLEGTVNGAGSALDWVMQTLGLGRTRGALADWLGREAEPPLFLNGVSGLGTPYWVPQFRSRFIGADAAEDWQRVVAVAESIVFLLQVNLEEMRRLASPPEHVQVTGGLARLDGLCQRLADVCGLPVYRPGQHEATARGTAYLLAGAPAAWAEADLGAWFKPRESPALAARYRRWRAAMEAAVAGEPAR